MAGVTHSACEFRVNAGNAPNSRKPFKHLDEIDKKPVSLEVENAYVKTEIAAKTR